MKLTEQIKFTTEHYAPACTPIKRYSISDISIDVLTGNLLKQGIEINPDYSEKKVTYVRKMINTYISKDRIVTVPLATVFPNEITPIAFYLRDGSNLKLELRNYDNMTNLNRPGLIGGTVSGEFGIICKLSLEGITIDLSIVEKVREAIKETYEHKFIDRRKSESYPELPLARINLSKL